MEVYDFITADQIEGPNENNNNKGDQVFIENDPIEVSKVVDSGDSILVKGYSHMSGDDVTYILTADMEVGLWGA